MTIEQRIQTSLQHYGKTIEAPGELDDIVSAGIASMHAAGGQRRRKPVYRTVVILLAGIIAVMTAAFSSPSLADRIYGSYELLKKKAVTATIQEYQCVGLKFAGAKRELGSDYPAFEKLARQLIAAKIEYANQQMQVDFSALTPETRAQMKQLLADIQPYFDRLNHDLIAKDILSPEQYDAYIEAQLERETIFAKAGVNPSKRPVGLEDLPQELRPGYDKAQQIIRKVEETVHQPEKPLQK